MNPPKTDLISLDGEPSEEMKALARRAVSGQAQEMCSEDLEATARDIVEFGCLWDRQVHEKNKVPTQEVWNPCCNSTALSKP